MKKKILVVSLTLLSCIALSQTEDASKKLFEYINITYRIQFGDLIISKSDAAFEHIFTDKKEKQNTYDVTPALKKITELENEGWQLHSVTTVGAGSSVINYLLRKERE